MRLTRNRQSPRAELSPVTPHSSRDFRQIGSKLIGGCDPKSLDDFDKTKARAKGCEGERRTDGMGGFQAHNKDPGSRAGIIYMTGRGGYFG